MKDRDLKWPESRKLSSLISTPDLRRCADIHLRHRVGSPGEAQCLLRGTSLVSSLLPHGSRAPSALGSSFPSITEGSAGVCWERHSGNKAFSSGKRAKRPSAVSPFMLSPESHRQMNPPPSGDSPRGVGWPQGRTAGEPGAQAWGLVLAERQGS